MVIFITGGSGFIGSNFIKSNPEIKFYNYDINPLKGKNVINTKDLNDISKSDYVMDLADIVGVELINSINLEEQIKFHTKVFKTAKKYNKHIMFFSTSEVFGENENITEESDFKILNSIRGNYALGKIACERLLKSITNKFTIIRPFNVVGYNQMANKSVMAKFCFNAKFNNPLNYTKSKRTFISIWDFIEIVKMIIERKQPEQIFNVGNPYNYIGMKTLAKKVKKTFKSESELIKFDNDEILTGIKDIRLRYSNFRKLYNLIDYEPKYSIDMIISDIKEYLDGTYDESYMEYYEDLIEKIKQ